METETRREWDSWDDEMWGDAPDGPWRDEPDKVQWVDEGTDLDCLIVRGPGGQLCGYVGVPGGHPWHGVDYSGCLCDEEHEHRWDCEHRPESRIRIHGGLTFADGCHEPDRESYEACRERARSDLAERGHTDARFQAALDMDFGPWAEQEMGRRICHVPLEGRPGDVWWFGFDCAHSGDLAPRFDGMASMPAYGAYRGLRYVKMEVASLAGQLARVGAP